MLKDREIIYFSFLRSIVQELYVVNQGIMSQNGNEEGKNEE